MGEFHFNFKISQGRWRTGAGVTYREGPALELPGCPRYEHGHNALPVMALRVWRPVGDHIAHGLGTPNRAAEGLHLVLCAALLSHLLRELVGALLQERLGTQ